MRRCSLEQQQVPSVRNNVNYVSEILYLTRRMCRRGNKGNTKLFLFILYICTLNDFSYHIHAAAFCLSAFHLKINWHS